MLHKSTAVPKLRVFLADRRLLVFSLPNVQQKRATLRVLLGSSGLGPQTVLPVTAAACCFAGGNQRQFVSPRRAHDLFSSLRSARSQARTHSLLRFESSHKRVAIIGTGHGATCIQSSSWHRVALIMCIGEEQIGILGGKIKNAVFL